MAPENRTSHPKEHWVKLRRLLRNPVSLAGVALALVSLGNIFLFSLIGFIAERPSPYIGILAYMVAPAFLICGLLFMAVGAWRERKKKPERFRCIPVLTSTTPDSAAR